VPTSKKAERLGADAHAHDAHQSAKNKVALPTTGSARVVLCRFGLLLLAFTFAFVVVEG
jgi:hypothetical protein